MFLAIKCILELLMQFPRSLRAAHEKQLVTTVDDISQPSLTKEPGHRRT